MTDQWPGDGWPEDEFDTADTADVGDQPEGFDEPPGFDQPPGLDQPGADASVDTADDAETEPADQPQTPLGYGDEPLGTPEDPEGVTGFGEADDAGEHDAPVGADPDLYPYGDDAAPVFPEPLDLGAPPEPVDGFPWTDAELLGGDGVAPLPDPAPEVASPPLGDLSAYAAQDVPDGDAGWSALIASPDPATSTLARFWFPGT
jgi:hypothetical protein